MEIQLDVDVFCEECGNELEAEFVQTYNRRFSVEVAPCKVCMEQALKEGKEDSEED